MLRGKVYIDQLMYILWFCTQYILNFAAVLLNTWSRRLLHLNEIQTTGIHTSKRLHYLPVSTD